MCMNDSFVKYFDDLATNIEAKSKGKSIFLKCNFGNWGDALIREGTLHFLVDYGFKFREILPGKSYYFRPMIYGGLLLFGGGGGWCRGYAHPERFCRRARRRLDVMVLPSTFENRVDIPGVEFWRRDDFLTKKFMPQSLFCHDMAFYLATKRFPQVEGSGVGSFFRTDREAAAHSLPRFNRDISKEGNDLTPTRGFFSIVNKFELIQTDRLHVAIAGALLGKKVKFYAGVFPKNEAIYQASLRDYFPSVEWCGSDFESILQED